MGNKSQEGTNKNKEANSKKDGKKQPYPNLPQRPNWFFIILLAIIVSLLFFTGSSGLKETTWERFEGDMLKPGDVERIVVVNKEKAEIYIKKSALEGKPEQYDEVSEQPFFDGTNPGPHYYFTIGSVETFERKLNDAQSSFLGNEKSIPVSYENRTNWFRDILFWLLPFAIIIGIWIFIMRRVQKTSGGGAGSGLLNIGKSKAKLYEKGEKTNTTFKDVAGLEEAKTEIREVVDFLKNPGNYTKLGAKIPKGVLMVGPPGTGKTLMGKAVAGEADVPFFSLSGSDFVEMFVGVGSARVRDTFSKAKEKSPCIIFIDEIDAIGRSRGTSRSMQSNDERESTLNQLLQEMDGFDTNTGVLVIAATNRADVLDSALLRPGRFDRHIYLELPNLKEREAIFEVHLKPLKIQEKVDLHLLASQTAGFSGADIANVCNEAALIAARNKKEHVDKDDFINAMDRIIAGMEKRTKVISDEEKEIIAYHEAGHAIISWLLENVDPLVKVSIIPRGKSLGSNWYLPKEQQIRRKKEFFDQICAALGGRAAEQIIFNEISSGALNDLEKVTKQAFTMTAMYGLNDKLGNISYYDSTGEYSNSFQKPYSEETAKLIDEEVRNLITEAYDKTLQILKDNQASLETIAQRLIEKEVIFGQDLEEILGKRPEHQKINAKNKTDGIDNKPRNEADQQGNPPEENEEETDDSKTSGE